VTQWRVNPARDDRLGAVLSEFGLPPESLLGWGGEARVYALDSERVLRVLHLGENIHDSRSRQALVRELSARGGPFLLPEVLAEGDVGSRHYTVERRLPGRSVKQELDTLDGRARTLLIERHLEASAALASLHLRHRDYFGELIGQRPVRAPTWRGYLHARASVSLQRSTPDLRRLDPVTLIADLPDVPVKAFVHLDAYGGNMLTAGGAITAVLDFGASSVAGDPRFDPVASAIYLSTPLITPSRRRQDIQVAQGWLRAAGLADLLEPVRRWLAAFWAFAVDDTKLHEWCRSVLLPDA